MNSLCFARLVKADSRTRTITGIATASVPDRDNETLDFSSSAPRFAAWSADQYSASNGRSYGNIREMHQPRAVGLISEPLDIDSDAQQIRITARIVDDECWKRICTGVLTGLSIGGRYLAKWSGQLNGEATTFYTAEPVEISVVDRPALPEAMLTVVKRDGSIKQVSFKSRSTQMSQFIPDTSNDWEGRHAFAQALRTQFVAGPSGDELTRFVGRRASGGTLTQGITESVEARLAKMGARVRGPSTTGSNGATEASIAAVRKAHEEGPGIMSPVSLPPQSANSVTPPTKIHPHVIAPLGDQYRTPTYSAPTLFGAAPHSASEHPERPLPTDADDRQGLDKSLAAIRALHRAGPNRGYLR